MLHFYLSFFPFPVIQCTDISMFCIVYRTVYALNQWGQDTNWGSGFQTGGRDPLVGDYRNMSYQLKAFWVSFGYNDLQLLLSNSANIFLSTLPGDGTDGNCSSMRQPPESESVANTHYGMFATLQGCHKCLVTSDLCQPYYRIRILPSMNSVWKCLCMHIPNNIKNNYSSVSDVIVLTQKQAVKSVSWQRTKTTTHLNWLRIECISPNELLTN